ncbi:baseplate J/gp47 family protein [Paenibacillus oleatilyticus]|uniref:baseplate J/gp47 family protein n=1 Tax=Paenibacillus oleatilyticus TaxID=2594886 RepID=UPI001C1FBFD9|nr:baseplate J/gp47 family protein [Paenibacillus oleatilyticus]MBU7320267.1 baseplate J/gp47 family protein [Paenibacillus oleatilyticus]
MATKDEILSALLALVPSSYDRSVGSFIYDSLSPVAEQLAKMDIFIDSVKGKLNIDNLTGVELAQRVRERTGIERKAATHSKGSVVLTGTGTITKGDLFETMGGIRFRSTETKSVTNSGTISVEAVVPGSSGNVPANTITLFPVTISGFTAVNNQNPTQDGFDTESDADLLKRYYERIRTPATSGNVAHYKQWAKEVSGVGDARVVPLWNGANTVKVVIIGSDKKPASNAVVTAAQNYIDPGVTGLGNGVAPIGAYATIVSATGVNINVAATVSIKSGYTLAQVTSNIVDSITTYLKGIAFVESVVSYARIGAAILNSEGAQDYSGLTVNGGTTGITIGNEEVAVTGTVTII